MRALASRRKSNASFLTGAFFLVLALTGCEQEKSTAKWVGLEESPAVVSPAPAKETSPAKPQKADEQEVSEATATGNENFCFLSYNLKNYLTMRRGSSYKGKPEDEIEPLVELIAKQKPDILGVCEIGTEKDLLDLQSRLRSHGLKLNHHEHTGGEDSVRHLGLLSRFPIVDRNSQSDLSYQLTGSTRVISRGLLDVTVDTGRHELRFLGVHLKSKREVDYADQELIRQNEARLFRDHATRILEDNPETKLIGYGDFNDTINSRALKIARGRRNSRTHLADYWFKDSRGELWTYFWDYQDIYSRFDYVLYSDAVRPLIVHDDSSIVDDPRWEPASDHRALRFVLE
jgi:endonuclease/exonuclease/phosphatase family metal-dependent hydrolase